MRRDGKNLFLFNSCHCSAFNCRDAMAAALRNLRFAVEMLDRAAGKMLVDDRRRAGPVGGAATHVEHLRMITRHAPYHQLINDAQ